MSKFILKLRHCNEQTMSQNYQAYIMLQKNWALAMVSLLLEEQMIISVTKTWQHWSDWF